MLIELVDVDHRLHVVDPRTLRSAKATETRKSLVRRCRTRAHAQRGDAIWSTICRTSRGRNRQRVPLSALSIGPTWYCHADLFVRGFDQLTAQKQVLLRPVQLRSASRCAGGQRFGLRNRIEKSLGQVGGAVVDADHGVGAISGMPP